MLYTNNCRICLSDQSDGVTLLFAMEQNDVKSLSEIGQMYFDCLRLELIDSQGYPKHICNYCKLQLNVFHNFMMMAKRSYEKFTKCGEQQISEKLGASIVKIEDDPHKAVKNGSEYELTENQQDEEHIDVWVVKYLDDDDLLVSNIQNEIIEVEENGGEELADNDVIKNKIIEVNEGAGNDARDHGEDYEVLLISQNDDGNTDQILEPLSKLTNSAIEEEEFADNYKCSQCNLICSSAVRLREHYTLHSECTQAKGAFNLCGMTFVRQTTTSHSNQMNIHSVLGFKCDLCNETFNFRTIYEIHMRENHTEVSILKEYRKYKCKICGIRFRMKGHLTYHQYMRCVPRAIQQITHN